MVAGQKKGQNSRKYQNIQILRVISVCGILLCHTVQRMHLSNLMNQMAVQGSLLVELFFIISGFLAIHSYECKYINNVSGYYRNRIIRILPLYYLIIIYFFVTETFVFKDVPDDPTGLYWLRYLFLIAGNIRSGASNFDFWTDIGTTWTIFVFVTFYLFVPLITKIVNNFNKSVVFVIVCWIIHVLFAWFDFGILRTLYYFVFFAFGISIYYSFIEQKENLFLLFLSVFLFLDIIFKGTVLEFNDLLLSGICFSIAIIATKGFKVTNSILFRAISAVDKYSYTVYLCQSIIFSGLIDKLLMNGNRIVILIISLCGTALLSYIVHEFYEVPIQKMLTEKLS